MKQIIMNYLGIFIVPALIGFAVRFLLRRSQKGYWVTVGLAILIRNSSELKISTLCFLMII